MAIKDGLRDVRSERPGRLLAVQYRRANLRGLSINKATTENLLNGVREII